LRILFTLTLLLPLSFLSANKYKQKIGILLPLTGKNAEMGRSALKGIQLAYYNFKPDLDLKIYDLGDTDQKLQDCLNQINLDMIDLVIGPILSKSVQKAQNFLFFKRPYFFSLSNNESLIASHFYNFGLTPRQQILSLFSLGVNDNNNFSSYNLLVPENEFGGQCVKAASIYKELNVHTIGDLENVKALKFEKDLDENPLIFILGWGLKSVHIAAYLKMSNPETSLSFLGGYDFKDLEIKNDPLLKKVAYVGFDGAKIEKLTKAYFKEFKKLPTIFSFYGLDIASILFLTIKRAHTQEVSFVDALDQTHFNVTTGDVRFGVNSGLVERQLSLVKK
jgi:ABC-type branched-subunit amino acid transport system substrate-binding protein